MLHKQQAISADEIQHYTELSKKLVSELTADEKISLLSVPLAALPENASQFYQLIHGILSESKTQNVNLVQQTHANLLRKELSNQTMDTKSIENSSSTNNHLKDVWDNFFEYLGRSERREIEIPQNIKVVDVIGSSNHVEGWEMDIQELIDYLPKQKEGIITTGQQDYPILNTDASLSQIHPLTLEQIADYQQRTVKLIDSYLQEEKKKRIEILAALLSSKHDKPDHPDLQRIEELLKNAQVQMIVRELILERLSAFHDVISLGKWSDCELGSSESVFFAWAHQQKEAIISNSFRFQSLDLSDHHLEKLTPEQWQTLGEVLKLSGVQSLHLRLNALVELTPEQWQAFCDTLKRTNVQLLDLSSNGLNQLALKQWQTLGEGLELTNVQSLDLSSNGLDQLTLEQWQDLGEGLKLARVRSLHLMDNALDQLTPEKWQALGNALKLAGIQSLNLQDNNLHQLMPEQWLVLGEALKLVNAQSLNLGRNALGLLTSGQWQAFCKAMKLTGSQSFNLWDNVLDELTPEGWLVLGDTLKPIGVRSLDLSSNSLGQSTPEKWQAFCKFLKLTHVQSLNLGGNGFYELTPEQWLALCEALKLIRVQSLNLNGNFFRGLMPEQWLALGGALKLINVQSLNLSNNQLAHLKPEHWQAFCEALKLTRFHSLDLGNNEFVHYDFLRSRHALTSEQWLALGEALKLTGVQSLNLSGNCLSQLTPKEWKSFCKALASSGITHLEIPENELENPTLEEIIELKGPTLSELEQIIDENIKTNFLNKPNNQGGLKELLLYSFWKKDSTKFAAFPGYEPCLYSLRDALEPNKVYFELPIMSEQGLVFHVQGLDKQPKKGNIPMAQLPGCTPGDIKEIQDLNPHITKIFTAIASAGHISRGCLNVPQGLTEDYNQLSRYGLVK